MLRYGPSRLLLRSNRYLQVLVKAWGNPDWSADVRYLRSIVTHCRGARVVVESGSGISTLVAAAAVPRGSTVVAFEHLDEWADRVEAERPHAEVVRRALIDRGGYDWYEVQPGDLPHAIDLVICDGPPATTRGGRYGLLPELRTRLAPGARILLDDAIRDSETEVIERWQAEGVTVESVEGKTALLRVG
jgi:predicted O-methyltransferase YrrM